MKRNLTFILITLFFVTCAHANSKTNAHPRLLLTKSGVKSIKKEMKKAPLFLKTYEDTKKQMDVALSTPMEVPVPKDAGGGYTHERHKRNYLEMMNAGVLYQISGDKKYAEFVKAMLLKYADMYPTLGLHPVTKSNYRGKLFWQGLNESVWLVHTAQAYDCIHDYLSASERDKLEKNLFYPMVNFLSKDNLDTFNKIHNHGTWSVVAVGMIGYAMGDNDLTEKALHGFYKDGNGGYLTQVNQLYSPDGYFTEGPYYQRYALHPFSVFAQVIQNNQPELNIFGYKNGVLLKAVDVQLQLAESNGQFFHLNDALDKTWHSEELVYAVDIAYAMQPSNKQLLAIAKQQDRVILSDAGLKVARALYKKEDKPFIGKSMFLSDGADGKDGAISILRAKNESQTTAVFKYTSHGLSHGHFDKLTFSFYDNGNEILQDYGAARFLNIEQKNGGHYLPENDSFAKQTIAHNTLTVDENSQFEGNIRISEKSSPKHLFYTEKPNMAAAGAEDTLAYPGVKMNRKMALISDSKLEYPILVDVFTIKSSGNHIFDLPFYFKGHLIDTEFQYTAATKTQEAFGMKNGYQHLWVEAQGKSGEPFTSLTFLNGNRFYTLTSSVLPNSELYLNRIGAGDPNFNLRNEPVLIIRDKNISERTYVNIIEPHGEFNPILEFTNGSRSQIKSAQILDNEALSVTLALELLTGEELKIIISR